MPAQGRDDMCDETFHPKAMAVFGPYLRVLAEGCAHPIMVDQFVMPAQIKV